MWCRIVVRDAALPLLLVLVLLLRHGVAIAGNWVPGPFDDGTAPNGANNTVRTSTMWDRDGEGPEPPSLVVGGSFTTMDGVAANRIARLDPLTGAWEALGDEFSNVVASLTVYNGQLLAGGNFSTGLKRWTGSSWQSVAPGSGILGLVNALTVFNGNLVVAGEFTTISGQPYARIASWNGTSWSALGTGMDQSVSCLAVHNGLLFAGGQFTTAGGLPSPGIAGWNGSAWFAVGTGASGRVECFTLHQGDLIAGGRFSTIGGVSATLVARWNGFFWSALPGLSLGEIGVDYVSGLASVGELYASVSLYQGEATWDGEFIRWNGAGWTPIGSANDRIFTLTNMNGELMAAGAFTDLNGLATQRLARLSGGVWVPFGGGVVTRVEAMTPFLGSMVAGGDFRQTDANGRIAYNIVSWNGVTQSTFGTGMNGAVRALEAFRYPGPFGVNELVAGGSFSVAGGVAAANIARWTVDPINVFPPPAWRPMGAGLNSAVYSIERHNGATYAAGGFTQSGSTWLGRIGRWNSSSGVWEPLLYPGMDGPVYAIKSYGGYLYAGGTFHSAGNVVTGSLARWDGSTWSQVGGYFGGTVYSLEVHGTILVIGGDFPGFNNSPNISTYNGINYINLGIGGTNGPVRALHSYNGTLFVGGDFTTAFGIAASGIAQWNEVWQQPGGGTGGSVLALSSFGTELQAGGAFGIVGGGAGVHSPGWARYSASGAPWIAQQPFPQSVASGTTVTFQSQPASGYASTTRWLRWGQPLVDGPTGFGSTISGATTPTLVLGNVSTADVAPYRMVATNGAGSVSSNEVSLTVDGATDVSSDPEPRASVFLALGPNPSRGGNAVLQFALSEESEMSVGLHDVRGREVSRTELGRWRPGRHRVSWSARRPGASVVAAGIYFVTLEASGRRLGVRQMVVLH